MTPQEIEDKLAALLRRLNQCFYDDYDVEDIIMYHVEGYPGAFVGQKLFSIGGVDGDPIMPVYVVKRAGAQNEFDVVGFNNIIA